MLDTFATFTYNGRKPRVLLEDPQAAHQIVLSISGPGNRLTVSCTCLVRGKHRPLAVAGSLEAEESLAIWRRHRDQAVPTA